MKETKRLEQKIASIYDEVRKMAGRYARICYLDVDDIIQNTMIKVVQIQKDREITRGWLYLVVRSSAVDAIRRAAKENGWIWRSSREDSRTVSELLDDYYVHSGAAGAADSFVDFEIDLLPRLKNVLAQLSKPLKQVLLLYSEGHSYQDIARLTNVSIGTVRSRLHHARRRARSLLTDLS